jgi:NlpC/P60 family
MRRFKSTLWMIVTGLVAICILIPSLPLQAAMKFKKKVAGASKFKYKKSKKYASKSHRKRHHSCNVTVGKIQALAFLQSSKILSDLAALEYKPDPNLQQFIENDGEELSDVNSESLSTEAEEPEDDLSTNFSANVNSFQKLWKSYLKNTDDTHDSDETDDNYTSAGFEKRQIMDIVMSWLGTPYYYGGTQRSGIDCSAFMQAIYRTAGNMALPRTANQQSSVGELVREGEQLRFGDLVFFNTRKAVYVSHVGLYLGDNLFAHASSRYGVTVSSLQADYYRNRYIGARRFRPSDVEALTSGALKEFSSAHRVNSRTLFATVR